MLILHHYDISPFAEKIRLAFGIKGLAWHSVQVPDMLPKPRYTALTGGYRRVPALQIGADVYCDTRLIVAELEHRYPAPSLFPGGEGLHRMLEQWAETGLFWPCARAVVGANAEHFPAAFHADRAAMRGRPPPSLAQVRRAGEAAHAAVRIQLGWIEDRLADNRRFLTGEAPGLADLAVYHALWFLERFPCRLLASFTRDPRIDAWLRRVAALGHGARSELDAEAALAIARDASPAPVAGDVPGLPRGTEVEISPEERTSPPVAGEVAGGDAQRIVIRRTRDDGGPLHVHFPRLGYTLRTR